MTRFVTNTMSRVGSLGVLFIISFFLSATAQAKLNGINVVFIHGFQPDHLETRPSYEQSQYEHDEQGNVLLDPVTGYPVPVNRGLGDILGPLVDARLNWRAHNRIEKDGGLIAQDLFNRAMEYQIQQQICEEACILITESAGDLVGRHFIENQEAWFQAASVPPFNIVATIDFVGAGGGTELADFGVFFGQDFPITPIIGDVITSVAVGWQDFSEDGGVVEDLATSVARNIATDYHNHGMPRFRISVNGAILDDIIIVGTVVDEALGLLMRGANDGVVPAHSTCGVQKAEVLESCSNDINYSGLYGKYEGPGSSKLFGLFRKSNLLPNFYPLIQSDNYSHLSSSGAYAGTSSPVRNNFTAGGINIAMDTYQQQNSGLRRLFKRKTWEYISGTENNASIQDVVVSTFN